MAVPFPDANFPANPPYPLKPFVPASGLNHMPAWAFRSGPPAPPVTYFDMVALVSRQASVTSNDQKTALVVTPVGAGQTAKTFNLAGDGTAEIPVSILATA